MSDDRFGGLPADNASNAAEAKTRRENRPYIQFTLPRKLVGWDFGGDDSQLSFCLVEITPAEQERASRRAGDSTVKLGEEIMFAAIYKIGDVEVARNRDFLNDWWRRIGPRGRQLVEKAFLNMVSVEEDDLKSFLDSGVQGS